MRVLSHEEKKAILSKNAVLGLLPDQDMDKLAAAARLDRLNHHQPVFHKGDEESFMLLVLSGHILISSTSVEGKEVVLNLINPGEVFGEISLLDGKARTADATALQPTEVLIVERRDFLPLLERNPTVSVAMIGLLCNRLRSTSAQVEDATFLDLRARLAKKIHGFAEVYGRAAANGADDVRIALKLTQRELGAMMGTSREAVNKQLRAWIDEGLISVDKGFITVHDVDELADQMEEDW